MQTKEIRDELDDMIQNPRLPSRELLEMLNSLGLLAIYQYNFCLNAGYRTPLDKHQPSRIYKELICVIEQYLASSNSK